MKKTFCDVCGKEIPQAGKPIKVSVDLWKSEGMICTGLINGVHIGERDVDICESCVKKLCKAAMKKDEVE